MEAASAASILCAWSQARLLAVSVRSSGFEGVATWRPSRPDPEPAPAYNSVTATWLSPGPTVLRRKEVAGECRRS